METIDGWEVDREKGIATNEDGECADCPAGHLRIWDADHRLNSLPARVARVLLGDRSPEDVTAEEKLEAYAAGTAESSEMMAQLESAIAALTGTPILPCASCAGHLSPEAHAQIRAAQSGWTAEGAMPWRPEVGERCFYYLDSEWRYAMRIEDCGLLQCFALLDCSGMQVDCDFSFGGIRPLGSLPVPASVRAKAEAC